MRNKLHNYHDLNWLVRFGILCWMAVFLTGCGGTQTAYQPGLDAVFSAYPELAGHEGARATVKRIVDGDTFEIDDGRKVRLVGVNTPEIHGKVQAFGQEANDYAGKQLLGKKVLLFPDVSETDRYGRLLRYVFIEGETEMFNERLVREGYAQVMTISPDVMFAKRFVQDERSARESGSGLWKSEASKANDAKAAAAGKDGSSVNTSGDAHSGTCSKPAIKGNINAKGQKIYHIPGSSYYNQTKAEMMFCTEDDAEASGFRKPK